MIAMLASAHTTVTTYAPGLSTPGSRRACATTW